MRIIILFILFFAIINNTYCQSDHVSTAKVGYLEVLSVSGPTVFTGNFDMRFHGQKGFGAHAGFGLLGSGGGGTILILPIGLNYLAGKAPHYVEAGAGATILTIASNKYFGDAVAVFVPSAAYRYQPAANGISIRVFVSPWVVFKGGFGAIFAGGLSVGYKF